MIHHYKGFNLLSEEDTNLFRILVRGEFMINGFMNKNLRHLLTRNSGQISRLLKRLRVHGLIKKIGKQYKYYLTKLGR
jgi:predicted transcriptional regulator